MFAAGGTLATCGEVPKEMSHPPVLSPIKAGVSSMQQEMDHLYLSGEDENIN